MKKSFCIFVFVLLVSIIFGSCSDSPISPEESSSEPVVPEEKVVLVGDLPVEFPLVSSPESLNVMISKYSGVEPEDVFVWKQYEEMTGVNINWTPVSRENRSEEVLAALTNNKPVDLILRCKISSNRLVQYGSSGSILDLAKDDLLKNNAPNCWAYLESHPDTMASIMNPDGTIYAIPQVNSGAELRVALKIFFNKQWLERVNMELPKTTEEFRALLEAFKSQDANGNGNPDDEIPLCCTNWQSTYQSLYGAFGLGNRGFNSVYVDSDPETGKTRLISASDSYKALLEYCSGLYSDGLLDNNIFSMTDSQWISNADKDLIGVFMSTNLAWVPADRTANWVAIEEPLEGPFGDKLWHPIRANFHSTGAAVIPSTCKNPELVLRWLDYFWTDEGTLFYHMGIEGETFVKNEDGTYDYAPKIYDEIVSGNHPFDDVVATYSPYPGGSNPTVEIAPYFMGGEMADVPANAARALFEYGLDEYWPSFTFTADETERLTAIQSDITKYSDSMTKEFVIGTKSLSDWESYKSQLESLGMAEMLNIYEAAVGRFNSLSTVLG